MERRDFIKKSAKVAGCDIMGGSVIGWLAAHE